MKKALGILSVLVLITVMMISCNAEQKLDDTVGVSFNVSSSRELSVANESFVAVDSPDLIWYYHGEKKTDTQFITGQSGTDYWTRISTGDALADTYQILKSAHVDEFGGVMHSFNGDVEWMKRFLDLGMEISYSGVVTFNSAKDVQEAMLKTPLEHLLVETDAPYLTPVPYRGQQNEPGFTRFTVEKIAELREQSSVEVALATFDNASRLFLNH